MQLSRTLHCRPRRLQTLVAFFPRSSSRHQTCTDAIPSYRTATPILPKPSIRGFGLEASPDTCLCRAVSYRATSRSPPDGLVRPRIAAAQPCPLASRPDLQILAWMPLCLCIASPFTFLCKCSQAPTSSCAPVYNCFCLSTYLPQRLVVYSDSSTLTYRNPILAAGNARNPLTTPPGPFGFVVPPYFRWSFVLPLQRQAALSYHRNILDARRKTDCSCRLITLFSKQIQRVAN